MDSYRDSESEVACHQEQKFLVFKEQLLDLFKRCPRCAGPARRKINRTVGSLVVIAQWCTLCDFSQQWCSQPYIGGTPAGNIQLSTAILAAGASPGKVLKILHHMNVASVSYKTFMTHQRLYIQSAVVRVSCTVCVTQHTC